MTRPEQRPVGIPERIEQRLYGIDEHLKVDPAPQRVLQIPGFPVAVALAQHDLRSLTLEIQEAALRPLVGNLEAENIAPKALALSEIEYVQLRDKRAKPPAGNLSAGCFMVRWAPKAECLVDLPCLIDHEIEAANSH
jgi:hypothetical protein